MKKMLRVWASVPGLREQLQKWSFASVFQEVRVLVHYAGDMVQLSQLQWYWYLFNKTYEFINSHLMQLCIQAIPFPGKLRNLLLEASQFGPEKRKVCGYIEQLLVSCSWYTVFSIYHPTSGLM